MDVLIVNETEARALTAYSVSELQSKADAELLASLYCQVLVMTCGAEPTVVFTAAGKQLQIKPPAVAPVDTVGAGDTFAGAFAVAYAETGSLEDSVHFANAAGALATLQPGAQQLSSED